MRRVALLAAEDAEGAAARRWLGTVEGIAATLHTRLDADPFPAADLLWIHETLPPSSGALLPWLQAGGRLLLTGCAVDLPGRLGLEPVAPDDRREGIWRHAEDEFWLEEYRSFLAFPHIRGLAGFGPHPLFAGLHQGTFTWAPTEGEPYAWLVYHDRRPGAGRVVAVERSFIHLNPERAVAWEYPVGAGGILCLGAFVRLAAPDPLLSRQLHALLANAVAGDAIPHQARAGPAAWWPRPGQAFAEDVPAPPPPPGGVWDEWPPSPSPIGIESPGRTDQPWTLAGRRILALGGECSGLGEVWAHPYRVLRDGALEVDGRVPDVVSVRVAPDEIVRVLRVGEIELTERVTVALDQAILFWSIVADGPVDLVLRWSSDLRRMWPYPAGTSRAITIARSEDGLGARLGLSDEPGRLEVRVAEGALAVADAAPEAAYPAVRFEIRGRGRLRTILVAGADPRELDRSLELLGRRKLRAFRQERILHARRLEDRLTGIETPDPTLDRGFAWAKVRLDSFLAETPGVGRSLLAGYARSRPGWADGRPGYAWYFGRDACWTTFATLAMGDRDLARDVLRFLGRTRDVSGKILHEYTTSGLIHYDAADSTPLFLLLAGRYAAWTGELDWLEPLWPALESAYRFCLETDTDGDGVIENRRIGHGWIEHGPLGGLAVTLYLAACWYGALLALEPVARGLGRTGLADELSERAARVRGTVRRRFREGDRYALGLQADGSARYHRTAMLAVPLLLGLVRPDEVPDWFQAIAGPGFSAPWGVRMIAREDPLFDPAGYHRGAVWPLYTGWVSLAEWGAGRYDEALRHLSANAELAGERAKGAFDEVLHGERREAAGICPDQAWSAAMVVSPAVEGLWGVVPDALNAEVRIEPWLPDDWPEMALRRLRVGRTLLDLRLRRRHGRLALRVERVGGPGLRVAVRLRNRASLQRLLLDGEPLGGGRAVFEAGGAHEVEEGDR